uniref:Predicted protein n=1 Tax=Hordeum vulgare subsp. vulgare TaxID=112509 RepID=F2E567_HORVV|nr:predicted protein [Hordeum vulgare subsp. vulgare]
MSCILFRFGSFFHSSRWLLQTGPSPKSRETSLSQVPI